MYWGADFSRIFVPGFPCIAEAFARRGYQRLAFSSKDDGSYAVRWVQHTWEVDFKQFRQGEQLVNVVAGIEELSHKANLIRNLQEHQRKTGKSSQKSKLRSGLV
jgi:hypothetical protein